MKHFRHFLLIILNSLLFIFSSDAQPYDPGKISKKAIALYNQAIERIDDGSMTNAAGLLQQAIGADKNYIDAYDDFGFATMLNPTDAEAKMQLQKLDPLLKTEYEKIGFSMQNAFQFFMSRADNQLKSSQGHLDGRAAMNYYKCIQLDAKNPVPYNKAGKIFNEFNMNTQAEQFLRYAAYADGKNPTYFEDLAVYNMKVKNYKSASGCLDTAALLGSTSADGYSLNGTIKGAKLNDYEGSIKSFNKSLAINPLRYDTYYSRALVHMNFNNYKTALEDIEAALKMEPKNEKYLQALKDCKEKMKK